MCHFLEDTIQREVPRTGSYGVVLTVANFPRLQNRHSMQSMPQFVAARLRLKVSIRTWIGSVPPRGSGWVRQHLSQSLQGCAPTRYRKVVLTRSNSDF